MKELKPEYIGFMLGSLAAFVHGVWSLLVAFDFAQGLLDWFFNLRFMSNPYQVGTFELTQALMLVVFTFGAGYVGGWIFAHLWNMLHAPVHNSKKK